MGLGVGVLMAGAGLAMMLGSHHQGSQTQAHRRKTRSHGHHAGHATVQSKIRAFERLQIELASQRMQREGLERDKAKLQAWAEVSLHSPCTCWFTLAQFRTLH